MICTWNQFLLPAPSAAITARQGPGILTQHCRREMASGVDCPSVWYRFWRPRGARPASRQVVEQKPGAWLLVRVSYGLVILGAHSRATACSPRHVHLPFSDSAMPMDAGRSKRNRRGPRRPNAPDRERDGPDLRRKQRYYKLDAHMVHHREMDMFHTDLLVVRKNRSPGRWT